MSRAAPERLHDAEPATTAFARGRDTNIREQRMPPPRRRRTRPTRGPFQQSRPDPDVGGSTCRSVEPAREGLPRSAGRGGRERLRVAPVGGWWSRPRSPERLIRRLGDHDTAEVLADSGQCRGAALGQAGDYRVLCVLSAVVMTSAPEPEITTPTWRAHGSWSEQRCRIAGVVCLGRTSAPEGVVSPRCCLPLAARIRRPVIHAQPLSNAHGCCQPAPERCPQPVEACWARWVPVPRMIMWRQPRGSLAICPVFDDDCRLRRGQGAARPVPSPCAGHGGAPARDRS